MENSILINHNLRIWPLIKVGAVIPVHTDFAAWVLAVISVLQGVPNAMCCNHLDYSEC